MVTRCSTKKGQRYMKRGEEQGRETKCQSFCAWMTSATFHLLHKELNGGLIPRAGNLIPLPAAESRGLFLQPQILSTGRPPWKKKKKILLPALLAACTTLPYGT